MFDLIRQTKNFGAYGSTIKLLYIEVLKILSLSCTKFSFFSQTASASSINY